MASLCLHSRHTLVSRLHYQVPKLSFSTSSSWHNLDPPTIANEPAPIIPITPKSKDRSLWDSPVIIFEPTTLPKPNFFSPLTTKAISFFQGPGIPKAAFLYSAASFYDHKINDYVPEVCILGCSNAGKSTFVNALLGQPLARSSSRPGYTKMLNAFGAGEFIERRVVGEWAAEYAAARRAAGSKKPILRLGAPRSLVVVDSPGYGFNSKVEWGMQIEKYLRQRKMLKGIILLIRAEVPLTDSDAKTLELLADIGKRVTIVLTRADRCEEAVRGKKWPQVCAERVAEISECLNQMKGKAWNWAPEVYVSAAGMAGSIATTKDEKVRVKKIGEHAGMGGARIAVLKMAGIMRADDKGMGEWEKLEMAVGGEGKVEEVKVVASREASKRRERRGQQDDRKVEWKSTERMDARREAFTRDEWDVEVPEKKKMKKIDYDNVEISSENKALEVGESGHTGFDGDVVSWDDIVKK